MSIAAGHLSHLLFVFQRRGGCAFDACTRHAPESLGTPDAPLGRAAEKQKDECGGTVLL
jgi:hypothetical protein